MQKLITEITHVAALACEYGWADATAGNFSVPFPFELPDEFIPSVKPEIDVKISIPLLLSATGARMTDLVSKPLENVVIIQPGSESGEVFSHKGRNIHPTSEWMSHVLPRKIPGFSSLSILHLHPVEAISITHSKDFCSADALTKLIWSMQPEAVAFLPEGVGFVPYLITGSRELAEATAESFNVHRVVFWEKHGILAAADSLTEAFDLIHIVIKSLKILFLCKQSGLEADGLSDEQITGLREKFAR